MTERMSIFDALRVTGASALVYSKDWHTNILATARGFTDAVLRAAGLGSYLNVSEPDAVTQSLFCNSILCGRWAASGFPTVTLGHKTAAAFMATRIKPDDAETFVTSPWPAFAIRLPTPLLTIDDSGIPRDAVVLIVAALREREIDSESNSDSLRWWYKLSAETPIDSDRLALATVGRAVGFFAGISLWGFNAETRAFAQEELGGNRWDTLSMATADKRCELLARQLIIATCLHLAGDPRGWEAKHPEPGRVTVRARSSKQRPSDTLPPYTEFEVRSGVTANLSAALRDFVARGGASPTVQSLVAGHWKRVVFGQGRTQRRLQHIEPYWRGPLDAPVSVRTK